MGADRTGCVAPVSGAQHATDVLDALDEQIARNPAWEKAHSGDPETSHEAAAAARCLRPADGRRIVEIMQRAARPVAACEIARLSAGTLTQVQVNRRMKEIHEAGLVVRTREFARTDSGRRAVRYELTRRGREA